MTKIPYKHTKRCCACLDKLGKQNVSRVGETTLLKIRKFFNKISVNIGDPICGRCRKKSHNNLGNSHSSQEGSQSFLGDSQSSLSGSHSSDETLTDFKHDFNKKPSRSWLLTAYATHKHCIICKRTANLHRIKPKSIAQAYIHRRIVIKIGTRCCHRHLDKNGFIKLDHMDYIETLPQSYGKPTAVLFDSLMEEFSNNESCIFEKFNNFETLDEDHCFNITSWNKTEFLRFSKYISSISLYNTSGRTKDQLIALYRFWLRKGIDQCSLAMFKNNTSQQQISHYLEQIRTAINKEFVPFFLGANRSRKFFLKHNNATTIELHQLGRKDLAIVADASYTRLEKSCNNQFQYLSYSLQKMDNLVKPFIICCTDGYFIDCYGPFQANLNDAKIFDYILRTDKELVRIMKPYKTVAFLDRG